MTGLPLGSGGGRRVGEWRFKWSSSTVAVIVVFTKDIDRRKG